MTNLANLQEQFQAFLLGQRDDIVTQVVNGGSASATERMGVYADAYHLRLTEALASDFKAVKAILGDDAFSAMCRSYIRTHTSEAPSIRWFGQHMADFLASAKPYGDQPMLAELAAFEWALTLSFDGADAPVCTLDDVGRLQPEAWPGMTLVLHPSLRRLDLSWNAPQIWCAVDAAEPPEPATRAEWPVGWVIWRAPDRRTLYRSMEVEETWAVDTAARGETLAAICDGLCEWIDPQHVALHAAGLLKRWTSDGLISRLALS